MTTQNKPYSPYKPYNSTQAGKLPVFDGYTVDPRMNQFRRVDGDGGIEFIDWHTDKGDGILMGMRAVDAEMFFDMMKYYRY